MMDGQNARKRTERGRLVLAVGGMALILAAVYAACGFWPFGPNSVMTGDLNSQYIPFYAHYYTALRSGEGSLFYADSMGMGNGAFALFAYYFASPFAWLYLLVAPEYYGQLCCVVYACKILLSTLAFYWYLGRHWQKSSVLWVPLSWCYGLMGYTVAYAQNVLWLDSVILLPLVCAGLDSLLREKKCLGFILTLAAAIFTNFYMGYMLCLFSALYLLAVWAAAPSKGWKDSLFTAGLFALSGIAAAALAGAVLLPAVREILGVKNTSLQWTGGVGFSLPELVQKLFLGNFVWKDVQSGLPPIYCGMLGLAAALLYAFSNRPRREKIAYGLLTAVLVASLWWQPLDLVWHGFAAPNWFPYRQSFLLVFWLLCLGGGAFTETPGIARRLCAGAVAAGAGVLVLFVRAETYGRRRWLLACGLLAAAMVLVWLYSRCAARRRLWAGALAVLTAGELCLNAVWALRQFEAYTVADYTAFVRQGRETVRAVEAQNTGGYRIEKRFFRTLNDPMLLGYQGLTHFSSVQGGEASRLMTALGYCNYGSSYGYLAGSTAAADSLLSVGYYLSRGEETVPSHFQPSGLETPWQVYSNPGVLPRVLWTAEDMSGLSLADAADPFAAVQMLYDALLGSESKLFEKLEPETSGGDRFTLTIPSEGILYAVFSGSESDVEMTVNGEAKGKILTIDRSSGAVVDLGRQSRGETVEIGLKAPVDGAVFALLDEEALSLACDALAEQAPRIAQWADGSVTLQLDTDRPGWAVLTVPYSENWRAEVDGSPAQLQMAVDSLLAVETPAGSPTLTLHYRQPGAAAGLALSLLGAAATAALAVWRRKAASKNRR